MFNFVLFLLAGCLLDHGHGFRDHYHHYANSPHVFDSSETSVMPQTFSYHSYGRSMKYPAAYAPYYETPDEIPPPPPPALPPPPPPPMPVYMRYISPSPGSRSWSSNIGGSRFSRKSLSLSRPISVTTEKLQLSANEPTIKAIVSQKMFIFEDGKGIKLERSFTDRLRSRLSASYPGSEMANRYSSKLPFLRRSSVNTYLSEPNRSPLYDSPRYSQQPIKSGNRMYFVTLPFSKKSSSDTSGVY